MVCPTPSDMTWNFSDEPCKDDNEYLDMLQQPSDMRNPEQRLADSVGGANYDSCEVGIQCFSDSRWPEKTDIACWWCLHKFDTRPFPCPVRRDLEGKWHVRGVFCGPSCAKTWITRDSGIPNTAQALFLVDELAKYRGYCPPNKKWLYIPPAPPRTVLKMFRGRDGMTIEQFRGLCANSFDISILDLPYVTQKQIVLAEFTRLMKIARTGRICHAEEAKDFALTALEVAQRKRDGLEIFAGVGSKRLSDYFSALSSRSSSSLPATATTAPLVTTAKPKPIPPPTTVPSLPLKQKQPTIQTSKPTPPTVTTPIIPALPPPPCKKGAISSSMSKQRLKRPLPPTEPYKPPSQVQAQAQTRTQQQNNPPMTKRPRR